MSASLKQLANPYYGVDTSKISKNSFATNLKETIFTFFGRLDVNKDWKGGDLLAAILQNNYEHVGTIDYLMILSPHAIYHTAHFFRFIAFYPFTDKEISPFLKFKWALVLFVPLLAVSLALYAVSFILTGVKLLISATLTLAALPIVALVHGISRLIDMHLSRYAKYDQLSDNSAKTATELGDKSSDATAALMKSRAELNKDAGEAGANKTEDLKGEDPLAAPEDKKSMQI